MRYSAAGAPLRNPSFSEGYPQYLISIRNYYRDFYMIFSIFLEPQPLVILQRFLGMRRCLYTTLLLCALPGARRIEPAGRGLTA